MRRTIASGLLEDLLTAASASPDREICGLLFGDAEAIRAVRATRNVSPHPKDNFEIDPQALFDAIRAERGGGAKMIGHYHSHPYGPAAPSARDAAAAAAEPGRLWLILGGGEARLYWAEEGGFRPVGLEIR